MVYIMTSYDINREPIAKGFLSHLNNKVIFDMILSVTQLEHDTVNIYVHLCGIEARF